MIRDTIVEGIASGWKTYDGAKLSGDLKLDCDVAIVGTGAGGGTAAEILTRSGLQVVMLEEGPLQSSSNFAMLESEAYPQLYQESAGRKTKDRAINILQGRCVGGSTTVNWTSSFRTPSATLAHWRDVYGLKDLTDAELEPWFAMMERRLNILPWPVAPNENNDVLARGARQLGLAVGVMRRNVKDCWNLGYCGMGCPTNAKQSMLVTTIPAALSAGARLVSRVHVERLIVEAASVVGLECRALDASGTRPGAYRVQVRARHYVLAAGAIGSPALLLRSAAPDPHKLAGRRTFLHPTDVCAAIMPNKVEGYAGAPQTVYCDHFLDAHPLNGPIGYKLEVPPLHPLLMATTLHGHGATHARLMSQFPYCQAIIALLRDGFHGRSVGGAVAVSDDGTAVLDYPVNDFLWDGLRRAYLSMAEIQFAAGAREVLPIHEQAPAYASWHAARVAIPQLPMEILQARIVSAHVMGGCAMGGEEKNSLVSSEGTHHHLTNLSIFDGSVFPTSVGANPQLSIYGLVARNASRLATRLTGRPLSPIA